MSRYVATYDISDDRQRRKVAEVLIQYGVRLQWSVFEVWLDPDDLPEFRRRIGSLLAEADEFDLIPVDERPNRTRMRWQRPLDHFGPVIIFE